MACAMIADDFASCQVDLTFIDTANTTDCYVPDTAANFTQHYAAAHGPGSAEVLSASTLFSPGLLAWRRSGCGGMGHSGL